MPKKVSKFIYWAPRIMSIAFLLFLAMFSLDIFDGNYGFWGTVLGLFMHNIPVFVLAIVLAIAWKQEIVGAVAFIAAGLFYIALLTLSEFEWYKIAWAVQISGPAFFVGILFLIGWKRKKAIKTAAKLSRTRQR